MLSGSMLSIPARLTASSTQDTPITRLTIGPAIAIQNSPRQLRGSSSMWAMPPNTNSVMRFTSIP